MRLVTHQTGPEGRIVRRLLIEEGADIRAELYIGMVVDRSSQRVVLMASSEGGMDIEEVAARTPEKIHKVFIDPMDGLTLRSGHGRRAQDRHPGAALPQAAGLLRSLYRAFDETDASLAEINPLIVTGKGEVLALDAKMNFDDNALFRHPEIVALRDLDEEDPAEIEASEFGLSYISLDGNIGCLVNGAGLAMATMDIIKLYGAEPANFLDVGGGATTEKVTEAFKLMLRNPEGAGHPGEHLRRDHEVRRHRARRGRGGAAGEAVRAPGGASGGHQRGPGQAHPRRVGTADHLGGQHGRCGAEGGGCRAGQGLT